MIVVLHAKAPDSVPIYWLDLCLTGLTLFVASVPGFPIVLSEIQVWVITNTDIIVSQSL